MSLHHFSKHECLIILHADSPHGTDDASEAAEKHRRRQVDGLIGCVSIAFGGLASTEDGKHSVGKVELHDILNSEVAILQNEGTPERIRVVDSMASKMENMSRPLLEE
jgi:hypothetical protein